MSYFNADQIAASGGPDHVLRSEAAIRREERARIRKELLEDAPNWLPVAADNERPNVDDFRAALDRVFPGEG